MPSAPTPDWLHLQQEAAAAMTEAIRAVADWSARTPCVEWDATALLRHVVEEQLWVPGLLAGGSLAEVADDLEAELRRVRELDGPGLARTWDSLVAPVAAAWKGTRPEETVELSYGRAPVGHYLAQQASDTAIHAWDLAASQRRDLRWPDDLAVAVRDFLAVDLADAPASLFAPAVPGYDTGHAAPQDAALAASGRAPDFPRR